MRYRILGLLLLCGVAALQTIGAAGQEIGNGPSVAVPRERPAPRASGGVSGVVTSNAGASSAAVCKEVPLPKPLRPDPLPTLAPLGRVESTRVNQFNDDYLYSPADEFKIGTRREWGSTVIFFGEGGDRPGINSTNTIDANDTGRELQVALYDYARAVQGCAWNATCLEQPEAGCGKDITFLGWNPVQGGDECNRGSGTDNIVIVPGKLESTVVPRFWNPDWKLTDCRNDLCDVPFQSAAFDNRSDVRYRQRLRFVDSHAVEMFMEFTNLSNLDHAPAFQEFPTLYSSFGKVGGRVGPDLWVVVDSNGKRIKVDQPSNNNFFRKRFESPGGFAALQNSSLDYGVGLYYETRQSSYQAWQRRGEFNNFRARFRFGLPARGKVRARAYLLIGSFKTIAGTARRLDQAIGPFGGVDSPLPDAAVGKKLTVSGWALDNWDVTEIELRLDGKRLQTATLTEKRPDICTLWPGYEMCKRRVGFVVEADLSKVSRCAHLLEVRATDTDGNSRPIARQRIFVKNKPRPSSTHPIYRFSYANGQDRDTRFGRTDDVPQGYAGEGQKFRLFSNPGDRRVPLWQTWCEVCTDHMQTREAEEGAPLYTGAELLGYCSKVKTPQASRELRRLNSAAASDHFVSADPAEQQAAFAQGYAGEGRCWIP